MTFTDALRRYWLELIAGIVLVPPVLVIAGYSYWIILLAIGVL